jgi:hypothetical protein
MNVLNKKLANSLTMKDLGVAKKILGMRITRDMKNNKLTLSQGEYIEKVLVIVGIRADPGFSSKSAPTLPKY